MIFRPVRVAGGRLVGVAGPAGHGGLLRGEHGLHPAEGFRLGMGADPAHRLPVQGADLRAGFHNPAAHRHLVNGVAHIRQFQGTGQLGVFQNIVVQIRFLPPEGRGGRGFLRLPALFRKNLISSSAPAALRRPCPNRPCCRWARRCGWGRNWPPPCAAGADPSRQPRPWPAPSGCR